MDLNQLVLKPGSFITPKFKAYFTDMLYQVPIDGKPSYIYLIIEHKSYPSKFLPLQLLEYKVAIWRKHLDDNPNVKELPLVYGVAFYHGRQSPYPYSMNIIDCFENPDLAKRLLQEPDKLIDVTVIPDEELTRHERAALLQLTQKYIFQNELLPFVKELSESGLLQYFDKEARQHLMTMIKYLLECGESTDSQTIIDVLIEALPNERRDIVSIAQQLEQRGIEKTARNALKQGADVDFVAKITGLTLEQVSALKAQINNE